MPTILLVGAASSFLSDIKTLFSEAYRIVEMTGEFTSIRSRMATTEEGVLYLIPHLSKPERYEIFCLARKNGQEFLTISHPGESTASDRNVAEMEKFEGEEVARRLKGSKIAPTTANKRSKGAKSFGDLKRMIMRVNEGHKKYSGQELLFKECESRVEKMWSFNSQVKIEDAEECYRKMIEEELRKRGY